MSTTLRESILQRANKKRPVIPRQIAELVFEDKLTYLVPQIYGTSLMRNTTRPSVGEIKAEEFSMVVMESIGATQATANRTDDFYADSRVLSTISSCSNWSAVFLGEPHRLVVALTRARWLLGIYFN
jgi:hypothetical protein